MDAILSHPHITELRERRKDVLRRLTGVVGELQHLKDHILPDLVSEYDRNFRTLEIALQKKTLETAELTRREELFYIKLSRGEKLTPKMIEVVNTMVDREFERVKKRLRETLDMTKEEREVAANKRMEAHNDSEFVSLYRSIVKKLHPDTASGTPFEQYWLPAQNAYQTRNMRELQAIHDVVCLAEEEDAFASTSFANVSSAEEYLEGEIARLESRLRNEERRLRDIVNNPPYTLRELMKSPTWVENECHNIETKIAAKDRDGKRAQAFLASIHADSAAWDNAEKSQEIKAQEEFANDFMQNTYFNNR
jgi:hypothetical protein